MPREIVVGGKTVPCDAEVVPWVASKLFFPGLVDRARTDFVVAHWTGSDGSAEQCFKTLKTRTGPDGKVLHLSAHFFVSHVGTVFQMADANKRCAHCGPRGNKQSVGIEASNRANPNRVNSGIVREVVRETINHETSERTTFTAPQQRSYLALLESLCLAYGLPFVVPMDGADVNPNVLSDEQLVRFRGVIGHFHLETKKQDCGLALLRAIAARPLRGIDGAAQ